MTEGDVSVQGEGKAEKPCSYQIETTQEEQKVAGERA